MSTPKTILVTGDVVRDLYIYQGDREHPAQAGSIEPYHSDQPGGAKCLFDLIDAAWPGKTFCGLDLPSGQTLPAMQTLWQACEGGTKKEHEDAGRGNKPEQVWRVANSLGYSLSRELTVPARSSDAAKPHSVLVLDDAGLAFRAQTASSVWPSGIAPSESQPEWIVLKVGRPVCQGDLWRRLIGGGANESARRENLVVIVAADELRHDGAAISRGFSWERTLNELCTELDHSPEFQPLLRYPQHLIVNFGCVGAVWFRAPGGGRENHTKAADRATLVYDPTLPEGGYKTQLQDQRRVYGHLNTFTAAIAVTLAAACESGAGAKLDPLLPAALGRGLEACRELRRLGHGKVKEHPPRPPLRELAKTMSPFTGDGALAQTVSAGFHQVTSNSANYQPDSKDSWSLAALAENPPGQPILPLYGLAHRVALYGYAALESIPHAHFGVMLSVDRQEMETLRGISQLIRKYQNEPKPKEPKPEPPLCLAAFGPPGAGKSFGIKEIVKEILGDKVPILDFNLSQFEAGSSLHGALHQVRDQALKGVTPVVFWDEFDSQGYKWLQYLLAPMQDGVFEENGHTHTVGKCIFVFAGATSWDFAHFGPAPEPTTEDKAVEEDAASRQLSELANDARDGVANGTTRELAKPNSQTATEAAIQSPPDPKQEIADEQARADFRRKKGPDFLSRLDAHIDVLGPNQRLLYNWKTREWSIPDPSDITFPVRRALLLRQFLGAKQGKDHLLICRDLLRAFLHVHKYRFSARSLEKVAKPAAAQLAPFRRAHLPPPQVLHQHLETLAEFDRIYGSNRDFLSPDNLAKIAAAIEENYSRHVAHAQGQARPDLPEAEFLKAFNDKQASADPWQQWLAATNLAAAKRLPWILALVGLQLEKGAATAEENADVKLHLEKHLAILAQEEHDLWVEFHLANGWRQVADEKLKELKALKKSGIPSWAEEIKRLKRELRQHTMLIPFNELDEEDKAKDHDALRNYPETVALVGWKIVFAKAPADMGAC